MKEIPIAVVIESELLSVKSGEGGERQTESILNAHVCMCEADLGGFNERPRVQ